MCTNFNQMNNVYFKKTLFIFYNLLFLFSLIIQQHTHLRIFPTVQCTLWTAIILISFWWTRTHKTWSHCWDESEDAQTHLSAAHRIWGWVEMHVFPNISVNLAKFYLLVHIFSKEFIILTGTGSIEIPVLCLLVHGEPRILQVTLNS